MRRSANEPLAWQAWNLVERLLAIVILVLLSPFLLGIATAIAACSGSSPLIGHRRLGCGGRPFWMLKFRTMWPPRAAVLRGSFLIERVHDDRGPRRKGIADPRVSSGFARFCRRHSIDELPQLLHVVRGEMSLVGPRPVTASEWHLHYRSAGEVLQVKPGLSGLWQVKGRSRLNYQQRRDLDLALVRNRSFKLYLSILLWTVPEILAGRNAW